MREILKRFWADPSGTARIEYALLVACIWLAVLSNVSAMGRQAADALR